MGEFANTPLTRVLAWTTAAIILGLNAVLLYQIFTG
jgi:Mn2+/Fe2+ NRAMP family transporter